MILDDPGGGLPASMLVTLLMSLSSFTLVFVYLLIQRVWQERTAENLVLLETLLDRTGRGVRAKGEAL
jgi:hypothetical protein